MTFYLKSCNCKSFFFSEISSLVLDFDFCKVGDAEALFISNFTKIKVYRYDLCNLVVFIGERNSCSDLNFTFNNINFNEELASEFAENFKKCKFPSKIEECEFKEKAFQILFEGFSIGKSNSELKFTCSLKKSLDDEKREEYINILEKGSIE